jgi:hypothetical protein
VRTLWKTLAFVENLDAAKIEITSSLFRRGFEQLAYTYKAMQKS